jgi:MarR family transcriptional regulator, transcriptional regulator for hemolysin
MGSMENLILDIVDTTRLIRREFDRRAATLGTTRAQWRVLVKLARSGGGERQVDLAEALDVEPISLCRMVDRLEQAGLVERRRDEEDRRAWRIHLTGKAAPIVEELQAIGDVFHGDAVAGVSREDIEITRSVLARLRANISASGVEPRRKAS